MKKLLIQAAAFIMALGAIFISILNVRHSVSIQIWGPTVDDITGTLINNSVNVNIALFTFLMLAVGFFVGLALFSPFYFAQEEKLNAYKRELEKSSVKKDSSSSQVKVLQAKVEVLERALKEALNK